MLYTPRLFRLLFPLLLLQNTVNALSDLLGFFYLVFELGVSLIKSVLPGGRLGVLRFPCLCRRGGLAVHHAFKVINYCREQDFFVFGSRFFSLFFR